MKSCKSEARPPRLPPGPGGRGLRGRKNQNSRRAYGIRQKNAEIIGLQFMEGKRVSFFNSISFKVPVIIVGIILIGIGLTIAYYLRSQNATIIGAKEDEIRQE